MSQSVQSGYEPQQATDLSLVSTSSVDTYNTPGSEDFDLVGLNTAFEPLRVDQPVQPKSNQPQFQAQAQAYSRANPASDAVAKPLSKSKPLGKAPIPSLDSLIITLKPNICYFGTVHDRGQMKTFGILQQDRRRHMYILGKTGMGKTTLLTNMILQDIYNGFGVCFIDPHGDPAEYILDRIPPFRQNDVVYFNPADIDYPIGFNMLEAKRGEEPFLIVSGMMAVFNRIWAGNWSARMEYILSNTLLGLLETPGNTLLGVVRMLTDKDFRAKIVKNIKDPMVRNFWVKEFASFNDKYRTEAIAPVLNKIGQFFSTDLIRNILGQTKSTIDMREIMDKKKILIVNLSKGRLGEDNSELLGSLLVTKLQLAAMSRVDIPEEERSDFYLYVDEFQNFTTDSFATILSEARKYRLNLILAHQYIAQLTETGNEKIKNAIFGNVGSIVSFRVGADDAERLAKEFEPVFSTQQLINLNATQIALKLSIDGKATDPFMANTLPPVFANMGGRTNIVVALSRERYARDREVVKDKINRWLSDDGEQEVTNNPTSSSHQNRGYHEPNQGPRQIKSGTNTTVNARTADRPDKNQFGKSTHNPTGGKTNQPFGSGANNANLPVQRGENSSHESRQASVQNTAQNWNLNPDHSTNSPIPPDLGEKPKSKKKPFNPYLGPTRESARHNSLQISESNLEPPSEQNTTSGKLDMKLVALKNLLKSTQQKSNQNQPNNLTSPTPFSSLEPADMFNVEPRRSVSWPDQSEDNFALPS